MFELEMKSFEVNVLKAEDTMESAIEKFIINGNNICNMIDGGFITESEDGENYFEENVKELGLSIKKFMDDCMVNIINLINEAKAAFAKKMQERQVNKNLKELKRRLAADKEYEMRMRDKTVTVIDRVRFMSDYKKYINDVVKAYTDLLERDFDTYEDFHEAELKLEDIIKQIQKKYNINDREAYQMQVSAVDAVALTEEQANNYKKDMDIIKTESDRRLKEIQAAYKKKQASAKRAAIAKKAGMAVVTLASPAILFFGTIKLSKKLQYYEL